MLVTWNDVDADRPLTSAEQVVDANAAVATEPTGIIANTRPLLWPARKP